MQPVYGVGVVCEYRSRVVRWFSPVLRVFFLLIVLRFSSLRKTNIQIQLPTNSEPPMYKLSKGYLVQLETRIWAIAAAGRG